MRYRWWIIIAAALFVGGLLLGLVSPANIAGLPKGDVDALKKFAAFLSPLPSTAIFAFILFKNISAVLVSFALSPVLCLVPIMALALNGWLIGFVSTSIIQQKSVGYLLAGILPHGIFEIPALIIGEAVALNFGVGVMLAVLGKSDKLKHDLKPNLKYLLISIILLLPAALIETFITPLFLR